MHGDGDAVIRLKEVVGVDEAEALRGANVAVLASERAELPAENYFLDDLVGLTVLTVSGEDLGQVAEVLENPANGIFIIRKEEKEILVPALKSVIREVDLKSGRMVVELPEEIDADKTD